MWKVKRYPGMSEHALTASVELIATTRERKPWGRPPIAVAFQASPQKKPKNIQTQCINSSFDNWGEYSTRLGLQHSDEAFLSGFWVCCT